MPLFPEYVGGLPGKVLQYLPMGTTPSTSMPWPLFVSHCTGTISCIGTSPINNFDATKQRLLELVQFCYTAIESFITRDKKILAMFTAK